MTVLDARIAFELPDSLAATAPPEARQVTRDSARLMVSDTGGSRITHSTFSRLPEFVTEGDIIVVNTSATINAAVHAVRGEVHANPRSVVMHLSTPLADSRHVVELRIETPAGPAPFSAAKAGERLTLPDGGEATLIEPYGSGRPRDGGVRLWTASLNLPGGLLRYTSRHGFPIRYAYIDGHYDLSYYQTIFAREPGSAEMPSAGRAFTSEVVARLQTSGVHLAPIVLHTGVSSLENDEAPYPERYRVPATTAAAINDAHARGARVIAVGTTVVRAVETVTDAGGRVHAGEGWTDLVITPDRAFRAVDAMLTGFHAPGATHLSMIEALIDRDSLVECYRCALAHGYLWHEFGDLHLILP
ncbi:MAG: S-adenosylmethionine:tRNA ribosyltransferase-isomerase [Gemmatimonadaceae bacterium]